MKNKFTILGCGSSLGSPWITNYQGKLKRSKKNQRTRCCAHIQKGNLSVLIDTSPDIKYQFLKNKIKDLDSIVYTHEHADQTAGIFEMRPFFWRNKSKIPIYGSRRTIEALKKFDVQVSSYISSTRKYKILFSVIQSFRYDLSKDRKSLRVNSIHGGSSAGYVENLFGKPFFQRFIQN